MAAGGSGVASSANLYLHQQFGEGGEKPVAVSACTGVPRHVARHEAWAQCWGGTVAQNTDGLLCFSIPGICIRGHLAVCDPRGVLAPAVEIVLRA